MMNLIFLIYLILFLIFNIILNISSNNPPVQIYVNKTKSRTAFKTKTGYKLELLSKETMQLLGSSKKDVDQNKDGED